MNLCAWMVPKDLISKRSKEYEGRHWKLPVPMHAPAPNNMGGLGGKRNKAILTSTSRTLTPPAMFAVGDFFSALRVMTVWMIDEGVAGIDLD